MEKTNIENCQAEVNHAINQISNGINQCQNALGVLQAFLYLIRKEQDGKIKDLIQKVEGKGKNDLTQQEG